MSAMHRSRDYKSTNVSSFAGPNGGYMVAKGNQMVEITREELPQYQLECLARDLAKGPRTRTIRCWRAMKEREAKEAKARRKGAAVPSRTRDLLPLLQEMQGPGIRKKRQRSEPVRTVFRGLPKS